MRIQNSVGYWKIMLIFWVCFFYNMLQGIKKIKHLLRVRARVCFWTTGWKIKKKKLNRTSQCSEKWKWVKMVSVSIFVLLQCFRAISSDWFFILYVQITFWGSTNFCRNGCLSDFKKYFYLILRLNMVLLCERSEI